jgi:flagellin
LFNGKTMVSTADINLAFGVTDQGGTVTLASQLVVDKSGTTAAAGAETDADAILADVGEALGNVAATMTVLKARQAVAFSASANMMAAASRLEDTDFAASSANLAKFSILNQSAMAMVAQANQAQSAVLAVLQ